MKSLLFTLAVVLAACKATEPKFSATIVRPDGKAVMLIFGTYDPGQSWVQANLGPFGPILSGLAAILQTIIIPAAPAVLP